MKTAIAITAGLMSLGMIGTTPAFAYHLIPENTNFTGKGNTSATKNGITLKCTAHFTGNVNGSGIGSVTGGSFTGQLGCSSVTLGNLPWTSTAVSLHKVNMANVTFQSPIGNCGPGTLSIILNNGLINFTNQPLPGGCTVTGHIATTPKLSIVK